MTSQQLDRPLGLTDDQWADLQWDCAIFDAELGASAQLAELIAAGPIPPAFRRAVAALVAALPTSRKRPALSAISVVAILRRADAARRQPGRPYLLALKMELAEQYGAKEALIADVLATRKTYRRFAKYRPLYARSAVMLDGVSVSATGVVTQRRKRANPPPTQRRKR